MLRMPHLPKMLQSETWLRYIVDHPRRIILLYFLLTLLFAFQLPRLQFRTGIYDLVIKDLPQTTAYNAFKKTFGPEELILVVAHANDVFAPATFKQLDDLSTALSHAAGIKRVISLPTIKKAVDVTGSISLDRFKQLIIPVKLFQKNLLSQDHKTTVIS
ncbi:MAG: histidine kinase, partial [Deltaproteobacteria bacterium]